ncbi:cell division cycle protein 20 homolog B [Sceloporus undulatus]|uniref:cell division cycle protein 20 homolog B n=1 Tax=Sceloporus undulatus TaxID=8520 RepID=UPI001C4B0BB4|nr:cell division cycle protein 20 homolog B [Sceloporus undulatus]
MSACSVELNWSYSKQTPSKTSYAEFKSCIVKKLAFQIPIASSPISTRWQQASAGNQTEQPFGLGECPPAKFSTLVNSSDLKDPAGKTTAVPVSFKILPEATINESKTYTNATSLCERSKSEKQKCHHQTLTSEGKRHGISENGSIRICEKLNYIWKGCKDGSKGGRDVQNFSAHTEACPLEPETRFHVTGLRDDYYLNILDWSQDNLLALALESIVHIWNGERSEKLESIDLYSGSKYIASLAWMRENSYLALGTSDGEVQLWDVETQKRLRNIFGCRSVIGAMSWNGYILSSGSRLGYIHHHDIREAKHYVGMVQQSKQSISSLQWSPDTKLLACGSNDGLLNIWSNDLGVPIQYTPLTTILHSSAVKAMRWCPWQTGVIATGGGMEDRCLRIWNISDMKSLGTVNSKSQICSLLWLPNTKEIVTGQGHPQNKVNIWRYPALSNSAELCAHKGRLLHMALSPEGNRIFTAAADETAYMWKYQMKASTVCLQ